MTLTINKTFLPLIASVVLASNAYALPDHSFFLGGQIGTAAHGVKGKETDNTYVLSVDKRNLAGRVSAGYQFNKNVAAELGYAKYKNVPLKHVNGGDARQQSVDLVAKATLPIANGFGVFGEGGIAYVNNKIDPSRESLEDRNIREHRYSPVYGAGVSYDIQNVRVNGGWRRIQHNASFHNIDFGYVGATVFLA